MLHRKINRISAIAPLVMSALAFILVLIAVATGWEAGSTDEGTATSSYRFTANIRCRVFGYGRLETDHAGCGHTGFSGRSHCVGLCSCPLFQAIAGAFSDYPPFQSGMTFLRIVIPLYRFV